MLVQRYSWRPGTVSAVPYPTVKFFSVCWVSCAVYEIPKPLQQTIHPSKIKILQQMMRDWMHWLSRDWSSEESPPYVHQFKRDTDCSGCEEMKRGLVLSVSAARDQREEGDLQMHCRVLPDMEWSEIFPMRWDQSSQVINAAQTQWEIQMLRWNVYHGRHGGGDMEQSEEVQAVHKRAKQKTWIFQKMNLRAATMKVQSRVGEKG